jgi:hypothetical protein
MPEGKRSFGNSRLRWKDVIRMDLRETGRVWSDSVG